MAINLIGRIQSSKFKFNHGGLGTLKFVAVSECSKKPWQKSHRPSKKPTKSPSSHNAQIHPRNPKGMILELAAVLEGQRESPQCVRTLARSAVEDVMLLPPPNFGVVDRGIYRSGFPAADCLPFLEALKLRSIVCLCPDPYSEENAEFVRSHGIRLFQFGIEGSRESLSDSSHTIMEALRVLLDARNHPILIHCNRGKHRTGCVVGCFRRLQNWCMTSVHEEYVKFASTKARTSDMVFIEKFDISQMMECVFGIIYQYHFSGHQARRLVYQKIS